MVGVATIPGLDFFLIFVVDFYPNLFSCSFLHFLGNFLVVHDALGWLGGALVWLQYLGKANPLPTAWLGTTTSVTECHRPQNANTNTNTNISTNTNIDPNTIGNASKNIHIKIVKVD